MSQNDAIMCHMRSPRHQTIRFKPEVHRKLTEICDANGLSLNWVVNKLIEEALDSGIQFRLIEPVA